MKWLYLDRELLSTALNSRILWVVCRRTQALYKCGPPKPDSPWERRGGASQAKLCASIASQCKPKNQDLHEECSSQEMAYYSRLDAASYPPPPPHTHTSKPPPNPLLTLLPPGPKPPTPLPQRMRQANPPDPLFCIISESHQV